MSSDENLTHYLCSIYFTKIIYMTSTMSDILVPEIICFCKIPNSRILLALLCLLHYPFLTPICMIKQMVTKNNSVHRTRIV